MNRTIRCGYLGTLCVLLSMVLGAPTGCRKAGGVTQFQGAGLYWESAPLVKCAYEFIPPQSEGLTVNHYADGCYRVTAAPNALGTPPSFTLYLVPNSPVTLGGADEWKGTVFETRRSIDIYRVSNTGVFVCVSRGRKRGDRITCPMTVLKDEVRESNDGLVKHREQVIRIDLALPQGRYVIFEGEGNVFDDDTFPTKEHGCWLIEVS